MNLARYAMLRLLIKLYPAAFRDQFARELELTTTQSLNGASSVKAIRTLFDLGIGAAREQVTVNGWLTPFLAILAFATIIWSDRAATENQVPAMVIIVACYCFSATFPRLVVSWALLFGMAIPVSHWIGAALRLEKFSLGELFALVVIAIPWSAMGAFTRKVTSGEEAFPLGLLALFMGVCAGSLDFTMKISIFVIVGIAMTGYVIGRFAEKPWPASVCLGLGVPFGVVFFMALGARPVRPHYILLDAQAVPIALVATAAGRGRRRITVKPA